MLKRDEMIELIIDISNSIYEVVGADFLISYFLKSTIILLLAYLIQLVLKPYAESLNFKIWNIALISVLLLPFLPKMEHEVALGLYDQTVFLSETKTIKNTGDNLSTSQNVASIVKAKPVKDKTFSKISFAEWTMMIWLSVIIIFVILLLKEVIWLQFLRLFRQKSGPQINGFLKTLQQSLSLNKSVELFYSSRVKMPITFGFFAPVIVLPSKAQSWSQQQVEIVLLHELSHIKRKDYLTNLLATLGTIFCWYNPLVWLALHFQKLACEKACDEMVLANNIQPGSYASVLLSVATTKATSKRFRFHPVVSLVGTNNLKLRIKAIVSRQYEKRRVPVSMQWTLSILMLFLVVSLTSLRFYSDANQVPVSSNIEKDDINELLYALKHPESHNRRQVALALINVESPTIIGPIASHLMSENDHKTQKLLIEAITKFGSNKHFYQVAGFINSEDQAVKIQVLKYMQAISCFPSYLIVEACQEDNDPEIALISKEVLAGFDQNALETSVKNFALNFKYNNPRSRVLGKEMVGLKNYKVINTLIKVLVSDDTNLQKSLGESLIVAASNQDFKQLKEIINNN